jgi:uncharacterized protein YbbC (DUF1343 family)
MFPAKDPATPRDALAHPVIGRRIMLGGMLGAAATPALGGLASAAPPRPAPGPPDHAPAPGRRVRPGVEMLHRSGYELIEGERVALISNPTGILPDLRHAFDVMHEDERVELVAAFGPEHGFRGAGQAGDHDDFFIDPRTGVPVYDAYSPERYARDLSAEEVDTVLFDIQDIGPRFYTFIWTMYRAMHGAALAGCRFVVLDRPNPISATDAHGPMLDYPAFSSGVGFRPIVWLHGMTVGELARLFNAELLPDDAGRSVELEVVEMAGWRRDMYFEDTGLPWVLPSPNIPTVDSAIVYPGTCLFEGTNFSEGRGTTRPFELIGAPWVGHEWSDALNELDLPGVEFREAYFQPTFHKFQGEMCGGVQPYVTDRRQFDAIRTGIAMLATAKALYADFAWRPGTPPLFIDLLTGSDQVRISIDDGKSADQIVAGWQEEIDQFREVREQYLIYK